MFPLVLLPLSLFAGIKIAGVEFVPRDLIFAAAEPKSRATAEGALPNECKWEYVSETRLGRREDEKGCVRYYYRTSVSLKNACPPPEKPQTRSAERITASGINCPDSSGKVAAPSLEAKAISSGRTAEGKSQEIVVQPDGTRVTILYDASSVAVTAVYPDGTADVLRLP